MIVSYRDGPRAFALGLFSLYNLIMTFVLNAMKDNPVGLYAMDDTTPLQDYSPFAGTATTSGGTPSQAAALVKGTSWAPVLNNLITATYACPVFQKTLESRPFSLEAWARVVNNSPSTSVALTNLITNPSFKSATTGWTAYGNATIARTAAVGGDSSTGYLTITATTVAADSGATTSFTAVVSTVYSATWQARNSGGSAVNVRMRHNGGSANYTIPNDSLWHTYTYTFTATNTAEFFRPVEFYTTGTLNGVVDLDTVTVVASSTTPPYFDGDMSGASWTGTANASTSILQPSFGDQKLLSHTDQYDGLVVNGTVVKFITTYSTAPASVCSYDMQILRNAHIVGVHTQSKNSLFVNGVLVAEQVLTAAQQADTFATNVTNLITGTTTSSQQIAVNGVGFYATAMTAETILNHYQVGTALPQPEDVTLTNFGDFIPLSLSNNNLALDQWISTKEDWSLGLHDNTDVINDTLVPTQDATNTSVASRWYYAVDLASTNSATLYGAQLDWYGNGATVAVSLDGTTWENVARGANCATIPAGTTTSGKVLQIRVTFPGGIVDDQSYVDNLNIVIFKQAASMVVAGRTITPTGAWAQRDHRFQEYHENHGMMIPLGANVSISADALGGTLTRTIELLIKREGGNPTVSLTGTNYINGAAGSAILPDGQWVLWHIVLAADSSAAIQINGPAQVAYVGTYNYALTAGQVAAIYADYVGTDAPRFADASVLGISESANAANIYQHDWSITSSG